jgi:hypothetical protein
MSKRWIAIIEMIMIVSLSISVAADTVWNGIASNNWASPGNWNGGILPSIPGTGNAIINPGTFDPTVSTSGNTTVGQLYLSTNTALNIVAGGGLSVATDLVSGVWGNSRPITVSGGTLTMGGYLNLGPVAPYVGKINITGGTVTAAHLSLGNPNAKMDISGTGKFILTTATEIGNVNYWLGANMITAYGGAGTINVDTTTNPTKIILTATIVPYCTKYPPTDISGPAGIPDCFVGIYDLKSLADKWITCNMYPQTACWNNDIGMITYPPGPAFTSWQDALNGAAFSKIGSAKLNATNYQYNHIGLAGTVLRVGPHGFTTPGAPSVINPALWTYYPFLAQQYWWGGNEKNLRQEPFEVTGGYGTVSGGTISAATAGTINASTFSQVLNLNGKLDISLDLTVSANTLSSQRTEFVTPNGVWVVRITDASSSKPFVLQVTPKMSYAFSAQAKTGGMVITATKSGAATAGLAIAGDNINVINTTTNFRVTSNIANQTVTFFIAPTSSYDPAVTNPANDAWARADAARTNGYANELQATLDWWADYNQRSTINLPASESDLEKWYVRSMYYHGVFYGKAKIPTGLWGYPAGPAQAICPQYDLIYSQLAMLYSNHTAESGNIVDWIIDTLPQARLNRTDSQGACSISHTRGAKYGPWVGYTGDLNIQTDPECGTMINSNDTSAACAMMAVKHLDFTLDNSYKSDVETVLLECAQLAYDDLRWDVSLNGYKYYVQPDIYNQEAAKYLLTESVARGIGETGWGEAANKVIIATGSYKGSEVLVPWIGMAPSTGVGDAPYMGPFWWFGFMDKTDPLLRPTWDWITYSSTRNYTFNRGQMSVLASKLYDSAEALKWAKDLYNNDAMYDDAAISEFGVSEPSDYQRCPEVAAHGAVMISVIQMLVDVDSDDPVEVFPAIPRSWWTEGVSFTNIAVKGGILVDGAIDGHNITINLANTNSVPTTRNLRVWLPSGVTSLSQSPVGTVVANGYATLSVTVAGNSSQDCVFVLPPFCTEYLLNDISGPAGIPDCYVNMYDFAALAKDWLTCEMIPQTACSE